MRQVFFDPTDRARVKFVPRLADGIFLVFRERAWVTSQSFQSLCRTGFILLTPLLGSERERSLKYRLKSLQLILLRQKLPRTSCFESPMGFSVVWMRCRAHCY